jgi:hypothetical protein
MILVKKTERETIAGKGQKIWLQVLLCQYHPPPIVARLAVPYDKDTVTGADSGPQRASNLLCHLCALDEAQEGVFT